MMSRELLQRDFHWRLACSKQRFFIVAMLAPKSCSVGFIHIQWRTAHSDAVLLSEVPTLKTLQLNSLLHSIQLSL